MVHHYHNTLAYRVVNFALDDTDNKRKEYNAPRLTHHMNLHGKHTISTCGLHTMNHTYDSLAALVHPIFAQPSFLIGSGNLHDHQQQRNDSRSDERYEGDSATRF